jgi:SAM-dependent methyltransferase
VIHEAAARGFARAVDAYERGRPAHPRAAVERLARDLGLGPGARVLDLAAGTGKLTRSLVETGAQVLAVEPVDEMRAALAAGLPQVKALPGTAEAIPLGAGAVDAVTVGQAFHWFDGDAALAEIHRVLAPYGRLGLIWNVRDDTVPWVARLTEIMEAYRGDAPGYRTGGWRTAFERTMLFTPLEYAEYRLEHEVDTEAVVARVASVSFIAALPEEERSSVCARVRALVETDAATRGCERFSLPYRTDVYCCARRQR